MEAPRDPDLLALWECGLDRHPIDRALLLGAWARRDLDPVNLADLPLGALNAALLRWRAACFGSQVEAFADCRRCGTRLEVNLEAGDLLAVCADGDAREELSLAGFRFRVPASRDLATVVGESDVDSAAVRILERCCLEQPESASPTELAGLLSEVEIALEMLDPGADFELALECPACELTWSANLSVPQLLWDEIDTRARMLLNQVHGLARSYGWTESEILSLSPERRAAYLGLVEG